MTKYGEGAPDPIGDAVKKLDMHVAAAGVHGPNVVPGTKEVAHAPEDLDGQAMQAEYASTIAQSNVDIARGMLEDKDTLPASTEFANKTLEKAANWIITPVDDLPPPLDLTKGMELPE